MYSLIIDSVFLTVSTVIGAYLGLFCADGDRKVTDSILSLSVGIMLYASFSSLILPRTNVPDTISFASSVLALFIGTAVTSLIQNAPGFVKKLAGADGNKNIDAALVFVTVIAVHKIPEGLAAGLTCAANGDSSLSLSIGLAIQNVPDGLIVSAPLTASGVSKPRAFAIAASTSLFSLLGVFSGYFGVSIASYVVEYALSFAGGMMIFVTFSLFEQIKVNKFTGIFVCLGIAAMMLLERMI